MPGVAAGSGRPLRFLALVAMGWFTMRVLLLWPSAGSLPAAIRQAVSPLAMAATAVKPPPAPVLSAQGARAAPLVWLAQPRSAPAAPFVRLTPGVPHGRVQFAAMGLIGFDPAMTVMAADQPLGRAGAVPVADGGADVRVSAWLYARGGDKAPLEGRLGGSQAGARLSLPVGRTLSAAGTIAAALQERESEARVGLEGARCARRCGWWRASASPSTASAMAARNWR